jgi:hypothetical protein
MYQAPDYLDPVQPTKEEIEEQIKQAQKDAKKTKKVVNVEEFYKPRMITPEPVYSIVFSYNEIRLYLIMNLEEPLK